MSSDSKKEIMEATYEALRKHGYADLSIEKIANEFDRGKSLIYYHYDDKQDLMISFLDYLFEMIKEEIKRLPDGEPEDRLDNMLEQVLAIDDKQMKDFREAIMEMQAQTPHDEEFAEKFREIDKLLKKEFKMVLQANGVQKPEMKANLLLSTIDGAMNRKIGYQTDRSDLKQIKKDIKQLFTEK